MEIDKDCLNKSTSSLKLFGTNLLRALLVAVVVMPMIGARACQENYEFAPNARVGTPAPTETDNPDEDDDLVPVTTETPNDTNTPQPNATATAAPTPSPSPSITPTVAPRILNNVADEDSASARSVFGEVSNQQGRQTSSGTSSSTARSLSNNSGSSMIGGISASASQGRVVQQEKVALDLRDNWLGKAFLNKDSVNQREFEDSDGDGIADDLEQNIANSDDAGFDLITSSVVNNPVTDSTDIDHDGLSAAQEKSAGTSAESYDTDSDGCSDAQEILAGADPLDNSSVITDDSDNDCISNADEIELGTDPENSDSDGDNIKDGVELAYKTDPNLKDTDGDGINDFLEVFVSNSTN